MQKITLNSEHFKLKKKIEIIDVAAVKKSEKRSSRDFQ